MGELFFLCLLLAFTCQKLFFFGFSLLFVSYQFIFTDIIYNNRLWGGPGHEVFAGWGVDVNVEVNKSGVYMKKGEYFDLLLLITDASFPGRHNYIREEFYDDGLKKLNTFSLKSLTHLLFSLSQSKIKSFFISQFNCVRTLRNCNCEERAGYVFPQIKWFSFGSP